MIVKDDTGQGGPWLASYLTTGKNERAEVIEYRNMLPCGLAAAIRQMGALARCGSLAKHILHVQMRAAPGERLSEERWLEAVDRCAEEFGLQEHQAVVVLHHQDDGCTHCHVVFNLVNPDTLKGVSLWRSHRRATALARQMEIDWGLRRLGGKVEKGRKRDYSKAGRPETEQARRAGEDVHAIRDRIRRAWERSDNGVSFVAALETEGFILARADRRDYVAVDQHGHPYSIGKRTTGAAAGAVREKLSDLDPDDVPSLEAVKLAQAVLEEEEALRLEKERKGRQGRGSGDRVLAPRRRSKLYGDFAGLAGLKREEAVGRFNPVRGHTAMAAFIGDRYKPRARAAPASSIASPPG